MVALAYRTDAAFEIEEPSIVQWFWAYGLPAVFPAAGMAALAVVGYSLSVLSAALIAGVVWLTGVGVMYILPHTVAKWVSWLAQFLAMSGFVAAGVVWLCFWSVWYVAENFTQIALPSILVGNDLFVAAGIVAIASVGGMWSVLFVRAGYADPDESP